MADKDHFWIQHGIKRPGRVHRYVHRLYGEKAFRRNPKTGHDDLIPKYLMMAKKRAEKTGNTSLVRAIDLAKELRKFKRR